MSSTNDLEKLVLHRICIRMQENDIHVPTFEMVRLFKCLPHPGDSAIWHRILEQPLTTSPELVKRALDLRSVPISWSQQPSGYVSFYVRTITFRPNELRDVIERTTTDTYKNRQILHTWLQTLDSVQPTDLLYRDLVSPVGSLGTHFIQTTLLLYPNLLKDATVEEVFHARQNINTMDDSAVDTIEQGLIALLQLGVLNTEAGGRFIHEPSATDKKHFTLLSTQVIRQLGVMRSISPITECQIEALARDIQDYANTHRMGTGTLKYPFVKRQLDSLTQGLKFSILQNETTPFLTLGSEVTQSAFRDRQCKPFFLGSSRSAHLVTTAINHFASWEKHLDGVDTTVSRQMMASHQLPFINLFNWPEIHLAALNDALQFVKRYLKLAQPVIVLTYGHLPSYSALKCFETMNSLQHDDFNLLNSVGTLYLRYYANDTNHQSAFIVLPSLHPGRIAHQGGLTKFSKSIYMMTAMKCWVALDEALKRSTSTVPKTALCAQIIDAVEEKTGPGTDFDDHFQLLKQQYLQELHCRGNAGFSDQMPDIKSHIDRVTNARSDLFIQLRAANPQSQHKATAAERAAEAALQIKWVLYSGPPGTAMASPLAIWVQAKKELDMLLACGFCWTDLDTTQRRDEAIRLYDRHVKNCVTPDALVGDWDQFLDFASSSLVSRGSSYYITAVSTNDAAKDLPNLLRCFLPEVIENPYDEKHTRTTSKVNQAAALATLENWLSESIASANCGDDEEVVQAINNCWPKHMQERDSSVWQHITKEVHCEDQLYSTRDNLNGKEITIRKYHHSFSSTGVSYSISWVNAQGIDETIDNLPLPKTTMPTTGNEKRYIRFVPEGIVIEDENRVCIDAPVLKFASRQAGTTGPPTYPTLPLALIVLSLQDHPHGKEFLSLWEAQCGTTVKDAMRGSSTASMEMRSMPANFFASGPTRALPLCYRYYGAAKNAVYSLLPVYPGDSLWLIHKFLELDYPQGGLVKCTNPAKDLTGESVFSKLSIFLENPLYEHHPHIQSLRSLCELSSLEGFQLLKATSTIKSALDVLRGQTRASASKTTRVMNPLGGPKINISCTQIWINSTAKPNAIADVGFHH